MNKDLLTISDLSPEVLQELLAFAFEFQQRKQGSYPSLFSGKTCALVFEKPSLRTKVTFEIAAHALGIFPVFLSSSQILASGQQQQGRESIPDIARNLERFCDIVVGRVYDHQTLVQMAESVKIPVINALCNLFHPCQALSDLMAMQWLKGGLAGVKVAYVGDGNNVATSLMQACALVGAHFVSASPVGYEIPEEYRLESEVLALQKGGSVVNLLDPFEAVEGADVVYTDTFVSMGDEAEWEQRMEDFRGYQVNSKLMSVAQQDAIFMHCLPAHRGEEVTNEVMDSRQSKVFDQAECRLHVAKAVLQYFVSLFF